MKKLLVLALVLVAANAFAQTDPGKNGIGIYFDESGTSNYLATATQYAPFNAYLLATNITQTSSGLSGWEAEIVITPAPMVPPTYTPNNGGLNVLTAPIFQVGMATALPYAPAMKLLTITIVNFGVPLSFAVGPCTPSSFANMYPGYADGMDPGLLIGLTPSADVPLAGRVNFYTVATFMAPLAPIATENDSWGGVKNLYQ